MDVRRSESLFQVVPGPVAPDLGTASFKNGSTYSVPWNDQLMT